MADNVHISVRVTHCQNPYVLVVVSEWNCSEVVSLGATFGYFLSATSSDIFDELAGLYIRFSTHECISLYI